MKKILNFKRVIICILSLLLMLNIVACSQSDATAEAAGYYMEDIVTAQAKAGAQLVNENTVGNIKYLTYYIGKISNFYVQPIMTPIYYDGSQTTLSYTERQVTSTTISNGISKAISTTESKSLTNSDKKTYEWSFATEGEIGTSGGSSITAGAEVGVDVGIYSGSASLSGTVYGTIETKIATTASTSGSSSVESSSTLSESVTEEINNSYDTSEYAESTKEVSTQFDVSNYEKNHYYALSLLANIDVYQVLVYYSTSDSVETFFVSKIKGNAIKMLYSDSMEFEIEADYQLTPITEISEDIIGTITGGTGGTGDDKINVLEKQYLIVEPVSCALDQHYDVSNQNTNTLANTEVDNQVCNLIINNAKLNSTGLYSINSNSDLGLKLDIIQDYKKITMIPVSGSGLKAAAISNDTYDGKNVYNVVMSEQLGYGGYYILIKYSDGTSTSSYANNIFNNTSKGSTIDLLKNITLDSTKVISEINISVMYEIKGDWQGFLGIWSNTYTNWRQDYKISFYN